MSEEVNIIQVDPVQLQAAEKAMLDTQVVTAKQYPRDIQRSVNDSVSIVTMSTKAAESCGYALPRGGKVITGPSVHLARVLAQNWSNIRVEAKIIDITATQIVSQAVCFDLQTNYAVKVEVRKSIMGKYGRYKDDMITVTGNAANSIAFRNAVFNVIPKSVTETVHQAAKNHLTGDLEKEEKLIEKRNNSIKFFKDNYNATEAQILKSIGVNSIDAIRQDQIIIMIGLVQAFKDGDSTPAEVFGGKATTPKKTGTEKKQDLKDNKSNKVDLP